MSFPNPVKVDQSQNQYDLKLKSQFSLTLQSTLIYRVFFKCLIFIDKDWYLIGSILIALEAFNEIYTWIYCKEVLQD